MPKRSRRHRSVLALVLTLTVTTFVADEARAQVKPSPTAPNQLPPEPGSINLTPFLGLSFGGNLENTPVAFGAALGYGFTRRVIVEGEVYFAPGGRQGVIQEFDTALWALSANLLYHFIEDNRSVTPYVVGGIGILTGDSEAKSVLPAVDDETSTVPSWNLGAGVKTAMNERWGVRGDLRYFRGDDFAPDHWRLYVGLVLRRLL